MEIETKSKETVSKKIITPRKRKVQETTILVENEPTPTSLQESIESIGKTKATKKKTVVEAAPKKVYNTYEDFDFKALQVYGAIDTLATSELLNAIFPALVARPKLKTVQPGQSQPVIETGPAVIDSIIKITHPCHEYILDMEINGFEYDCQKNREFHRRMTGQIDELEDRIFSQVGKRFNINSGPEVMKILYEEMKFTPPFLTKSGQPATDGAALMALAGLDPLGRDGYKAKDEAFQFLPDITIRNDIISVHGSFISTYIDDWVKRDGRIHPSYNLHGTSSFRISGDNPNLTNLPRPKHGYNVRECYTVKPGHFLLCFDFSSAEVKVLAAICRDENMLKAISEGLDFHSFSASLMYGIPYGEFIHVLEDRNHPLHKDYKLKRQISKTLTFSIKWYLYIVICIE